MENAQNEDLIEKLDLKKFLINVVVGGQGSIFALGVGYIVGPLNYNRCDNKHRLPCTITPFY